VRGVSAELGHFAAFGDQESTAYAVGYWSSPILVALVAAGLLAAGISRRRATQAAKGDAMIAIGAVLVVFALAMFANVLLNRDSPRAPGSDQDVAKPGPIADTGPGKTYEHCADAVAATQKFAVRSLELGEQGRVTPMMRSMYRSMHVVTANPDCYKPIVVDKADDLLAGAGTDAELPERLDRFPSRCWQTATDVSRLLNFAAGMKNGGNEAAADRLAKGFDRLSARDPECFGERDVDIMKKKLADHDG
jgi:hypothetical protein